MITQGKTSSFILELPLGYHVFGTGIRASDTFKIALYRSTASLDSTTTVYTSTGETSGGSYVAGGSALTVIAPAVVSQVAYWGFNPVSWSGVITARGALIYNSTQGNRSVCVLDFGADKTSASSFNVAFPATTYTSAVIRIS